MKATKEEGTSELEDIKVENTQSDQSLRFPPYSRANSQSVTSLMDPGRRRRLLGQRERIGYGSK